MVFEVKIKPFPDYKYGSPEKPLVGFNLTRHCIFPLSRLQLVKSLFFVLFNENKTKKPELNSR